MKSRANREVELFLREAESRWSCLDSVTGHLHRMLERRVGAGQFVSPLPRLYARAELWAQLTPTLRTIHLVRGLQMLHPTWVFCGTTAAVMHGLDVSWGIQEPIEFSSPSGRSATADPRIVRRYVSGDSPVEAGGVRVTSLPRTLLDCMRRLGLREGLAVADSALHHGLITQDDLLAYVGERHRGMKGIQEARLIARMADPRPQNGMESIARAVMHELGFAAPDLQAPFEDPMNPGRIYYVDFRWVLPDGSLVVGELDGGEKYANPLMSGGSQEAAMRRERRRESRISIERPRIVRFTPEDVEDVAYFNRLLETFGVPRDHEPIIEVPKEPVSELVPVEAYGLA